MTSVGERFAGMARFTLEIAVTGRDPTRPPKAAVGAQLRRTRLSGIGRGFRLGYTAAPTPASSTIPGDRNAAIPERIDDASPVFVRPLPQDGAGHQVNDGIRLGKLFHRAFAGCRRES